MKIKLLLAAVATVALIVGAQADDEPDIKKGEKVFKKCKACHVVDKKKNKIGPHLVGIIDRPFASVEKFKYSKAMKAKVAEEPALVWSEENISQFITKPKAYIKRTKMTFVGLKKEKDRNNVIAYIKSLQEKSE